MHNWEHPSLFPHIKKEDSTFLCYQKYALACPSEGAYDKSKEENTCSQYLSLSRI